VGRVKGTPKFIVTGVGTIRSVYPERHMLTSIKASEGEKSRADKIALF